MQALRKTIQKGFTLVELLIVVIILALLAAIVVPQFASSTDDAKLVLLELLGSAGSNHDRELDSRHEAGVDQVGHRQGSGRGRVDVVVGGDGRAGRHGAAAARRPGAPPPAPPSCGLACLDSRRRPRLGSSAR